MSTQIERLDYDALQAIVAKARMERSAAVADAIAGLMAVILSALERAVNALKSRAIGAKSRGAAHDAPIFDASGHR